MNRREVFRTLAAGGATGAFAAGVIVATTPAPAFEGDAIAQAIELELTAYREIKTEEDRLWAWCGVAYDNLPEWVQSGPSELHSDGTKGGRPSGWPEVADLTLPPEGETRIIRQGPHEYWKSRKALLTTGGEFSKLEDGTLSISPIVSVPKAERRAIRLETIAGMRRLIARKREADAIYAAAGIEQAEEAADALSSERHAIQDRVLALASGCSLLELGVHALFGHREEETDFTVLLMRRLLPHLTGSLHALVQKELSDFDKRNGEA